MEEVELEFLTVSPEAMMQHCVTLFENEAEKGRAFVSNSGTVTFDSITAYSSYYQLSECLRGMCDKSYRKMHNFITDNYKKGEPL